MRGADRRHRDMGGRKRGRIVHAVADHHHLEAVPLKCLYPRNLVGGRDTRGPSLNTTRPPPPPPAPPIPAASRSPERISTSMPRSCKAATTDLASGRRPCRTVNRYFSSPRLN